MSNFSSVLSLFCITQGEQTIWRVCGTVQLAQQYSTSINLSVSFLSTSASCICLSFSILLFRYRLASLTRQYHIHSSLIYSPCYHFMSWSRKVSSTTSISLFLLGRQLDTERVRQGLCMGTVNPPPPPSSSGQNRFCVRLSLVLLRASPSEGLRKAKVGRCTLMRRSRI